MNHSRIREKHEIITKILYTFLFSVLGFYAVDINTYVYLIIAIIVWTIVLINYKKSKNISFYSKAVVIGISNMIAFALMKYIDGYRFIFDMEDILCCLYVLTMAIGEIYFWWKLSKDSKVEEKKETLFSKRKHDLERVMQYLSDVDIIGLEGGWGSGKTFLVRMLREDQDIKENYIFIKIDLLSSNLDSIEKRLVNELDNVLNKNRIYSANSTKLKKVLDQDSVLKRIGEIIGKDNESYSDVFDDFKKELERLEKTIVIVYEDIDRIDNGETIKKIFSISENLASNKVKIIYEYNETNIMKISDQFNRDYLEKYIPFTIRLTNLGFFEILDELFKKSEFENLDLSDFDYLKKPININPYIKKELSLEGTLKIEMTDISTRKVEHFLKEVSVAFRENSLYKDNKQDVITVYYIKHFWYSIYEKFNIENTIIDNFRYKYKDEEYTLPELINLVRKSKDTDSPSDDNQLLDDDIKNVFDNPNNRNLLGLFSLFEYECDTYQVERNIDEISNEPIENITKTNKNEKKDRLLWNLICNGKSQYTDRENVVNSFKEMVISSLHDKRDEGFNEFCNKLNHGEFEKKDNKTIFLLGVSPFLSLFQAYRVVEVSSKDWLNFLEFYMSHEKINNINIEYIENLNYCKLDDKEVYLYVLNSFCKLTISGNINKQKCYKKFLRNYLEQLANLGFINTEELWLLDDREDIETIGVETIIDDVLNSLKKKLNKLKDKIFIEQAIKDIDIIINFIDKNIQIIQSEKELKQSGPRVKIESEIHWKNQVEIDRLKEVYEKKDFKTYKKEVENSYKNEKLTAGELAELPSIANKPEESLS